jgi:hypothetical protein
MSAWKQWWNCLWNNRPADDDWIEWLIDFTGFLPIQISILVLTAVGFAAYCLILDWWYMKRPLKDE